MSQALALPPLPEGFTIDEPMAKAAVPQPKKLPPLPEGFTLDGDSKAYADPAQPITAPKPVEEPGFLASAANVAKGIGEQAVDLVGQFGNLIAATAPSDEDGVVRALPSFMYSDKGKPEDSLYPTKTELQAAAKELRDFDLGYEPGTTWEQVKEAPTARNILGFAVEQGLVSTPDMLAAVANLPGYVAARTGGLAQDRAINDGLDNARPEDVLKVLPAATATALLDRLGGRSMLGISEVATQGIKQIPKEVAKSAVKEGVTEAAQEGIESAATTAGTEKGFDTADTLDRMLAGTVAGGVTGGAVRAGTSTVEAVTPKDTPVEGDPSATVETAALSSEAPVSQDGGEMDSPPVSSPSSISPEERAVLRRTSIPDEDIDAMSREEIDAKISEARAAGIKINGAMVRAAEQYRSPQQADQNVEADAVTEFNADQQAEAAVTNARNDLESTVDQSVADDSVPPAQRLIQDYQKRKARNQQEDAQAAQALDAVQPALSTAVLRETYENGDRAPLPRPEPVAEAQPDSKAAVSRMISDYRARNAAVDQAAANVQPDLETVVDASVAEDTAAEAQMDRDLGAPLSAAVLQSVYQDRGGEGSRLAPKRVELPEDIDVAAQRVNVEPTEAQKEAGNYQKGHIKVGGLDITIENPKGGTRTGSSPTGQQWSVQMPAHYGYVKRSSGADGDQVDVYVGDNPSSKRVYVVDQRDPSTRRFDEHKAIMGVDSVTAARDLYARGFSDRSGLDRLGAITPMSVSEFKAWLRDGDPTKPLRMGKGVRTNDAGFPVDLKGAVKKPDSLIEFLARKGGVREDRGELTALGLRDRATGFVVGAGPVIRPKGMHPDKAREAAAEAGYLDQDSTTADLYDALDADARSSRQQFSQYDDDWAMAWRDGQGGDQRAADEDSAHSTEQEVRDILTSYGYPVEGSERFITETARAMDTGLPFEEAVESAYAELARQRQDLIPAGTPDIPFFGDDDVEVQPRTAPEGSATVRTAGKQGAGNAEGRVEGIGEDRPVRGEGRPESEGDRSREDGGRRDRESTGERAEPVTEAGADNFPQTVIPGAERASDAKMAQRGADAPLKHKAAQKDPGGLFSDEMDQADLLDLPAKPQKPKPPATVYHGTSSGGFDSFDTYQGKYGLFGSGGYFTEDPAIALEYTRKGRGQTPTVYRAKVDIKNAIDMDAPADVQAWIDAFPDYIDRSDLVDFRPPTNENAYRVVEDNLSHEMIPDYEGAEIMQDGLRAMGHDGVTHIGGGRHKASKGTKHRVWIAFDPEQVTSFEEEARQYSVNPEPDDTSPQLSEAEQRRLAEIVGRTSGIDPSFADSIKTPEGETAAGFYSPLRDVIVLALDTASVRADKVAFHESFHRLQNLFLADKERKLLKAEEPRLRKMVADKGEYSKATVEKMSRKEVEAEAFGIWAAGQDNAGVHIGLRKIWKNIRDMLTRARNYLQGRGYQTLDDVFGRAKSGETAKRPRQEAKATDKDYSIVERAPDQPLKPKTSVPAAPRPKPRFSDRLTAVGKIVAAKAKSKGGRFDRLTEDDGELFGDFSTRKVLDYLDPVLKMQQKVGVDLNDLSDAYLTARLSEGTIRHELHQVDEKYVQPAIKELAAVKATEEDLHLYMYAMHVPERNRIVGLRNEEGSDLYKAATDPSIRGASGMSTNEAKATLAELAKDREKFIGIRRAASHIRAMLDDGLKRQLRAGLINKASYDELTQQWQHYVPLRAESDQDGVGGGMPSKSRGFDIRGDEFKGATGRYTKADNVVNYAVNNVEQSIIRAEKNKAATAALRFINQFDPEGESIAKVYWSEDPDKLGDITKAPPVYRRKLDKDGKVTSSKVNAFQMKDDVLAAKIGGKVYYMQFADPKVGLALKKMTFGELGVAMKMVRTVSGWQSLINTRANPAFVPINMIRDIQTGATLALDKEFKAGEVAKMVGSIPKAWAALWRDARGKPGSGKWDQVVADFKANGGKISFDQYNTIEETAKKIQKDLHRAGTRGGAGRLWRGFIDLVENLNDTIENGMRLAVFNAAVERGQTPKRAAFLARDLTVDFQKKGEITPHMNALYTFFNASVQGNFNFAKSLYRSRKIKVAMGALVMAGYAQHVINSAMAGDDDDGENAYVKMLRNEPWTFERNIVLFLPGSKEYIKIPLGFGMNAFWHLGAQAGAVTSGDKGFLDATLDSTRVGFDAFNPLGSGSWVGMALPTVIDPVWELGTNSNFSGNPIYPQESAFDPAPPPKSEQAFKSTSPVFRWGAETLNKISGGNEILPGAVDVYPDSLEYLWGWFTGGVGRFASQSIETAQRGIDMEFEPKKTPFIRSFYGAVDDQGKRSEYYAQRERVQFVKGKMKEFQDAGDRDGLKEFMADHPQEKQAIGVFDTAEKMRRKINKQRRALEKRDGSSSQMKALEDRELEIMNKARKAYFEAGNREP